LRRADCAPLAAPLTGEGNGTGGAGCLPGVRKRDLVEQSAAIHGSNVDLLHLLFGSILAVDDRALILIGSIATVSILSLAVIWRALVAECFDPGFLRTIGGNGGLVHTLFLALVVLSLVAGFQALGTLMAVGLMMLPAAAARFGLRELWPLCAASSAFALASGFLGLLLSYHLDVPSGPAIILVAGLAYLVW
jgi:zinc/manganese transport system permease protein